MLGRSTRLRVGAAAGGEPIERGRVYVAPVENHLPIEDGAADGGARGGAEPAAVAGPLRGASPGGRGAGHPGAPGAAGHC
ncbi:chemotaxis protein CheB [Sorangium sp. So ce327]|uniref:chemotaxis protein CheB n=1 Tax=unclassified Sorangium TaxID=2621164 RepID=UPI003F60CDE5